jgi:hypothetical protein
MRVACDKQVQMMIEIQRNREIVLEKAVTKSKRKVSES